MNIKYLPDLSRFKNLQILKCSCNSLTSFPTLPQNIKELICYNNELNSFPNLSKKKLERLEFYHNHNHIYEIVDDNSMIQIKKNIQILNNFRYLYYCLKFKKQFRKWL